MVVCQFWNEFIGGHVFKRRVEALLENDDGLQELAEQEQWNESLHIPTTEVNKQFCEEAFKLELKSSADTSWLLIALNRTFAITEPNNLGLR